MSAAGLIVFAAALFAIVPLLGGYMARVFTYEARRPQTWKAYAGSVLGFSAVSWLLVLAVLRPPKLHPLNPPRASPGTGGPRLQTPPAFVPHTHLPVFRGGST